MKKTSSAILSVALLTGICAVSSEASIAKGQKRYMQLCKKCHGNGVKGAAMHTQEEWEAFFEDPEKIISVHQGKDDAKAFKSIEDKVRKNATHLKEFLYEYGSDSGNIPACG